MHCTFGEHNVLENYRRSFHEQRFAQEIKNASGALTSEVPVQSHAVVGLILKGTLSKPDFLLTHRPESLGHHPNQVALPGGRVEAGETPLEALSREVQEEVGFSRGSVLWEPQPWDPAVSLHGSLVFPFVGVLSRDELPARSPEVDDWAWCSWESLVDKSLWKLEEFQRANGAKLLMPVWKGWSYPTWGLTAFFLRSFLYRTTQDPLWLEFKTRS